MQQYTVIAPCTNGRRVFEHNEVVTQTDFRKEGHLEDLLKNGFLKPLAPATEAATEEPAAVVEEPATEAVAEEAAPVVATPAIEVVQKPAKTKPTGNN